MTRTHRGEPLFSLHTDIEAVTIQSPAGDIMVDTGVAARQDTAGGTTLITGRRTNPSIRVTTTLGTTVSLRDTVAGDIPAPGADTTRDTVGETSLDTAVAANCLDTVANPSPTKGLGKQALMDHAEVIHMDTARAHLTKYTQLRSADSRILREGVTTSTPPHEGARSSTRRSPGAWPVTVVGMRAISQGSVISVHSVRSRDTLQSAAPD